MNAYTTIQRRRLIRASSFLLVAGLFFATPQFHSSAERALADAIAATVDKEVILLSDLFIALGNELDLIRESATSQSEYDRKTQELLRATLEIAIESKILYREARKLGLEVTDERVEAAVDIMRAGYDSEEEFIADLQENGESLSEYRERRRKNLMAQDLAGGRRHLFEEEVVVSDAEIAEFYDERVDEFKKEERVRVRQVFLLARDSEARARAREQLEQIKKDIEAGADFADQARAHSQAPGAEDGGIIGLQTWHVRGDLIVELEEPAFVLDAGATSDIIESRNGLHLLKVDEREVASFASLEEVRLIIEPEVRKKLAEERYVIWVQDLRKSSRVRIFL